VRLLAALGRLRNCFQKSGQILCVVAGMLAGMGLLRGQEPTGPAVLPPPDWGQPQLLPPTNEADRAEAFEAWLPPEFAAHNAEVLPPGALEAAMDETILPPPLWYEPAYWLGPYPWDMGVELGINGSHGNNDVFSMRAGGHVKRATPDWKLDSSLSYNKNHSNGAETQNNGKHDLRADRILAESPWTLFVLENFIYDEFQAWDVQLSLNTGVGYQLIKTTTVDLLTRSGAGATREFGGAEEDWQPTGLLGVDYNHQITPMQKLTAKVDYYPEWEDFRQYRVVSDIGWQVDLDRPKNVSLKFSLIDRYDSTPEGASPNNLDYAVLMIWKL
jgi:putative salt-induced outer membrane protein YdiY